jgi:hypothetical protein
MISRLSISFCFLGLLFGLPFTIQAQYFYKDILKTKEINQEFASLKMSNTHLIKLKSFEDDDEPSEGFFCEKKINKDFSKSEMVSKSFITEESLVSTFYSEKNEIIKVITTTSAVTNSIQYEYGLNSRLTKLIMVTSSNLDSSKIEETREYFYSANNNVEKMIRKKNGQLIATITFQADENGNIIEEKVVGSPGDIDYLYYYDTKNRLTDVVHYNTKAQKLLPDFIFDYNSKNQVKQMMSVDNNASNYLVWKYSYNEHNLPEIQKCYSKEKRLLGTIEFEYK